MVQIDYRANQQGVIPYPVGPHGPTLDLRGAGENMSVIRGQIQYYAFAVAD